MINPKSLIEMLESSYDGIWITDGNGRILFANSANASLLGVTKEDLMGKSTEELLEKKIFSDSVCLEAIEQKRQTSKVCYNYNTQLTVLATATPIFGEKWGSALHIQQCAGYHISEQYAGQPPG